MAAAYIEGDNTGMTATDTQKNLIYYVAKTMCGHHSKTSCDEFAMHVAHLLCTKYPLVSAAKCIVREKPWKRVQVAGSPTTSGQHTHGFMLHEGGGTREATALAKKVKAIGQRDKGKTNEDTVSMSLTSSILDMTLLKTTCSGYEGFLRDELTLLPDTNERMLASSVSAHWSYTQDHCRVYDYNKMKKKDNGDYVIDVWVTPYGVPF